MKALSYAMTIASTSPDFVEARPRIDAVEALVLYEYTSLLPLGDQAKSWISGRASARATLSVQVSCAPRHLR
jgi:hypothetical protein